MNEMRHTESGEPPEETLVSREDVLCQQYGLIFLVQSNYSVKV
jgi:hypothetical protein